MARKIKNGILIILIYVGLPCFIIGCLLSGLFVRQSNLSRPIYYNIIEKCSINNETILLNNTEFEKLNYTLKPVYKIENWTVEIENWTVEMDRLKW